jgi:hypothetical protein
MKGAIGESGACGRKLLPENAGIGCGGGLFAVVAPGTESASTLWRWRRVYGDW